MCFEKNIQPIVLFDEFSKIIVGLFAFVVIGLTKLVGEGSFETLNRLDTGLFKDSEFPALGAC